MRTLLSLLELALIAQGLESRERGHANSGCLLGCQIVRLQGECVLREGRILSERALV